METLKIILFLFFGLFCWIVGYHEGQWSDFKHSTYGSSNEDSSLRSH
jgi:hypothetical protein